MIKMYLKKFLICFFILLLFGCAKIEKMTKLDDFDVTTRAYSHHIRWSEWDDAAIFLKSTKEDSDLPDPELMKMIKVTDYSIKKTAVSEDQTKVVQIVELQYYRNDRMIVETIREKELWEWDSEKKKWELSTGLPKFE